MSELPKLPDLPSLDDFETNDIDTKKAEDSTPSLSLPELPELPSLDDLEAEENSHSNEYYSDDEGFIIEDNLDDSDEGITPSYEVEETNDIKSDESEIEDDFVTVDDWDEEWDDEHEELSDIDIEENPFMGFLPPADIDEVDIDDETIEELESHINEDSKSNENSNELDEEAIKEFFVNLKNKILPKKDKNKPGPKIKQSKDNSDSKLKKLLVPIITIIIIIAIALGVMSILGSGFKPLNELEIKASSDDTHIIVNNFNAKDSLSLKVTNDSDSSIEMFIDLTLSEKGAIPFMGKKHTCSSEFIGLEVDEETDVTLDCNIDENLKYKATIDITNTY